MAYAKTSLRGEQRVLRERMRAGAQPAGRSPSSSPAATGCGTGRRGGTLGRSLKEAAEWISDYAARSGLDLDGATVAMTALRLSEYENWPGLPIIVVPFLSQMLARHPAFVTSITTLRSWGIHLIFDPDPHPLPVPNQGESSNALFPWAAVREELGQLQVGQHG